MKLQKISFSAIFLLRSDNSLIQLFRYTFVGGIAFLVDFSVLYVLTEYCYLHYLYSAGIAFTLGLFLNYALSIAWVFNSRKLENRVLEFLLFSLIGLIGLIFNELFLYIFTDILAMYYLISKIATAFIVYIWNFTARKIILFNK